MFKHPTMLLILDGWGMAPPGKGNAVSLAETPVLDRLFASCPHTSLACSGVAVGLPAGLMGNSEVGHLNLGAGRVVYQDILRVDMAIEKNELATNEVIENLARTALQKNGRIHLMGLVSDGGVHSQQSHLHALLDIFKAKGLENVFVHAFLDGRDTPPESGAGYVKQLQQKAESLGQTQIATMSGRFYAMDRDKRWDRVEKAYNCIVCGQGEEFEDPVLAVEAAYSRGETDEFVVPQLKKGGAGTIKAGDVVLFFNFRADRARELTQALTSSEFDSFERQVWPKPALFATMTSYDGHFDLPIVFPPHGMQGLLGEAASNSGVNQLRIAETEKYAHVTYFFNGGEENPFKLEDRCLVPSPRDVATYDLKPEMSAFKIAANLVERIESEKYGMIICNFANLDMVGHTGNIEAAIQAVQTVDQCVGKVLDAALPRGWKILICADHGNAEEMLDEHGGKKTSHTTNPVPLLLVGAEKSDLKDGGRLADVAPTILDLMHLDKPVQMTGKSLHIRKADSPQDN